MKVDYENKVIYVDSAKYTTKDIYMFVKSERIMYPELNKLEWPYEETHPMSLDVVYPDDRKTWVAREYFYIDTKLKSDWEIKIQD